MGQLRKRGDVWWIRYYRNGRRFEESARTDNYKKALDLLKVREGDVAKGVPVSPRVGRLRFEEAAADLVTEYTINRRKTLTDVKRRIDLHLSPFFAGRRMSEITSTDVRTFTKTRLARRCSACNWLASDVDDATVARCPECDAAIKAGARPPRSIASWPR